MHAGAPINRWYLILQNDIKGVDDAGDVTKNGEQDVDEKVGATATLKEDTERREDDGKDDLADVACGESHCDLVWCWTVCRLSVQSCAVVLLVWKSES